MLRRVLWVCAGGWGSAFAPLALAELTPGTLSSLLVWGVQDDQVLHQAAKTLPRL